MADISMRKLVACLLVLAVSACASSGETNGLKEELERYQRHAGADMQSVRYASIRNWTPVGHHAVVFEFNGPRHYLVDLSGPCDLDLRFSSSLRLESVRRNALGLFDRVIIGGEECRIESIRPVDMDAVEQELAERRAEAPEARSDVTVETDTDQESGGT